jgi:hypothetical protein
MSGTVAYKFLRAGGVGPFTGFAWPLPENGDAGPWVEADGSLALCANGVHACRTETLARWLDEELWALELEGEVERAGSLLVGRRARLLAPIAEWDAAMRREFAFACAERAAGRTDALAQDYARDAATFADNVVSAQDAAEASYVAARAAEAEERGGFDAERRWQSLWLADRLGLERAD